MAKQKTIGVTLAEHMVLENAKKAFEALTNCNISWGAYLVATSSGALATFAIKGLELSCPQCGKRAFIRYIKQSAEDGAEPGPVASMGPGARRKP